MTRTFTPSQPNWCAGCGHFGVQGALVESLTYLGFAPHETVMLAGIGCSGTMQNNVSAYGYHATHGRVLPTATGMVIANPGLIVIASGGDGDGYAIGMGHLVHTFRRNPSMLYIVMNNGTYGLTKGQPSPTAHADDSPEPPLDAVQLGLAIQNSTFIARAFVGRSAQLNRLMREGLLHAKQKCGFAFLEVMSPCVTYNETYTRWEAQLADLDRDAAYDSSDRIKAAAHYARLAANGKVPVGLVYRGSSRTYEAALAIDALNCPAHQDVSVNTRQQELHALLEPYEC
jgi:2-oxoglutarate/2-oxoacid ferredoxin oxidoreductase subunit beta